MAATCEPVWRGRLPSPQACAMGEGGWRCPSGCPHPSRSSVSSVYTRAAACLLPYWQLRAYICLRASTAREIPLPQRWYRDVPLSGLARKALRGSQEQTTQTDRGGGPRLFLLSLFLCPLLQPRVGARRRTGAGIVSVSSNRCSRVAVAAAHVCMGGVAALARERLSPVSRRVTAVPLTGLISRFVEGRSAM